MFSGLCNCFFFTLRLAPPPPLEKFSRSASDVHITTRVNYTCISPIRKYTTDYKLKETINSFDRRYIWEFHRVKATMYLQLYTRYLMPRFDALCISIIVHAFSSLFQLNSTIGGIHQLSFL